MIKQNTEVKITLCPICESDSFSLLFKKKNVPLHPYIKSKKDALSGDIELIQCKKCRHFYNKSFDEKLIKKLYSSGIITNTPVSNKMQNSLKSIKEWLIKACKKKINFVLEIGGGSGSLAIYFSDLVKKYFLIEPSLSDDHFKRLSEYKNITPIKSNFPHEIKSKTIDLVICRQVLEHINNPKSFLNEIHKIVSYSTFIYIEIPNADYIIANKSIVDFHYPHIHYYHERNIKKLFAKIGFKVIKKKFLKNSHDMGFLIQKSKRNFYTKTNFYESKETVQLFKVKARKLDKRKKIALYGANAYSQSFLGLYADKLNIIKVFDDTPFYENNFCYYMKNLYPIYIPNKYNIHQVDEIIITAYLHDDSIFRKLESLEFQGNVYTVRNDKFKKNKKLKRFFI